MTQAIVAIAITCCTECHMSYDLDEWRALELKSEKKVDELPPLKDGGSGRPAMHFELRECPCGHVIKTRVDGLDDLELFVSADAYADAYGPARQHLAFMPALSWWETWRSTLTLIGLVSVALVLVSLLVVGLVRVLL